MKITTWNVNSVRMRAARVVRWMQVHQPDVLCLQETKVEDLKFPIELFTNLGYHVQFLGEKKYNGVAIASKLPVVDVVRGFDDGNNEDTQCRVLTGTVLRSDNAPKLRVSSVYIPNGQTRKSDKFVYKLGWLERLQTFVGKQLAEYPHFAICGDYNIAPADIDVHDPAAWKDSVLCTPEERAHFAGLGRLGFTDSFRHLHPDLQLFSWWDYRRAGFQKNQGLRIDHILTSPALTKALQTHEIDSDERIGQGASDHAPVSATFTI